MLAQGRINPQTYAEDRTLRHLIDVVPFGLPGQPPRHEKRVLRGVNPAVKEGDRVILWGGGIWQWLDPLTLISAMPRILDQRRDVRLFFPGTRPPHANEVPDMQMRQEAIELSDELGLTGEYVIFGDWMPYEDRQSYLLEADVGVSLHFDTLESRFAFRTRLLDYFWAGLPTVATQGDPLSELVEQHNLGCVVGPEDVEGVANAILQLLAIPNLSDVYRPRFNAVTTQLTWPQVVEPLTRFCHEPKRALDQWGSDKSIYQAWIGGLQRESRRSAEAQISHLERHVETLEKIIRDRDGHIQTLKSVIRNLEEMIGARDAHVVQLTQVIEEHNKRLPAKVYRALKQLWGQQR
jgi:hypothetical protein